MLQVKPICSGVDRSISKLEANLDANNYASSASVFPVGDEFSRKNKMPSDTKPKFSLLNFLKSHNSSNDKIFKPIGNKIVVPIKIPISSKKLAKPVNKKEKVVSLQANTVKATRYVPIQKSGKPLAEVTMLSNIQVKQEKESNQNPFPQISNELEYKMLNYRQLFNSNEKNEIARSVKVKNQLFNSNEKNEIAHSVKVKKENVGVNSRASNINVDCDLTSLSWLITSKNENLMDIIRKCNPDVADESSENKINSIFTASSQIQPYSCQLAEHPTNLTYNPRCKPPFSFSILVFMAIEESIEKRLMVKDIYKWVCKHFPYFRDCCPSWKNSIRHNLSLNRCFMKLYDKVSSKSSFWCINPAYRPNLVEALKRSHFLHPNFYTNKLEAPLVLRNLSGSLFNPRPVKRNISPDSKQPHDPDITTAALDLIGLKVNDSKSTKNAELINSTINQILQDSYFEHGCFDTASRDGDTTTDEMIVIHDRRQDHEYCVNEEITAHNVSPCSGASAPDAAYQFETGELFDNELDIVIKEQLDMDIVQDIIEDIMIGSDEEKESLFDSGFGSIKDFDTKKRKTKTPQKKKNVQFPLHGARYLVKNEENKEAKMTGQDKRMGKICFKSKCAAGPKRAKKNIKVASSRGRSQKHKSRRRKNASQSKCDGNRDYVTGAKKRWKNALETKRKLPERKRRLPANLRFEVSDEEVKLAAGSLLRLAGLMESQS